MGDFFAELRRRHIYRIGAGYVIVAWAIAQVIDLLSQIFALPDWIAQPAVIVLAIGFPVTLVVAWLIEGQAHKGETTVTVSPATKVDWVIAGGLAAVIGLIGYQQFAPSASQQAGVELARQAADSPDTAVSVAVLPFANMSDDPQQQFFSDGMTEEISFALAKVPDLRVVARTSAFEFREQDRDFQSIGQALNATHFIDGSVRREGERVRITARLIEAIDSTQVWAENYDRELTDVFAVQEEIATAIAGALNMQLGLAPGENLISSRTDNLEVYQDFLRARALFQARSLDEVIPLLESIVAREPDYVQSWTLLSSAYRFSANRDPNYFGESVEAANRIIQPAYERASMAAAEAIRLGPDNPGAIAAQAFTEESEGRFGIAEDLYRSALSLDPTDPEILDWFSQYLAMFGRINEALEIREQLRALEPFVPTYNIHTANYMLAYGPDETAIQMLEETNSDDGYMNYLRAEGLASAYAELGRYNDAADALIAMRASVVSREAANEAAEILRSITTQGDQPDALPELPGLLRFVYVHAGAPERVMDYWEQRIAIATWPRFIDWSPEYTEIRQSERFKNYIRASGTYDYWRERGFADLCRPVGVDDFECD